jgi:hypothetical protein
MNELQKRRSRLLVKPLCLLTLSLQCQTSVSFLSPGRQRLGLPDTRVPQQPAWQHPSLPSSSALSVWWFGGTETVEEVGQDADSCELVAVRIERTSANSRRILGEIIVPVPLMDVWAILTDYNRLSVHVPNLVESKIISRQGGGEQGDGSYQCRLFQKGAQKIIGFEFGASVTMDMKEQIKSSTGTAHGRHDERCINFKCADSFFFQEFDGAWNVNERIVDGTPECVLSYVVDVRPKGPVPVAALEWRIREDVPTNLRAVKKAAIEVGYEGVKGPMPRLGGSTNINNALQKGGSLVPVTAHWDPEETMAVYIPE